MINFIKSILSSHWVSITKVVLLISLLQWIFFAPLYFSRMGEGSFFPNLIPFPISVVSRNNPDFFRWSLDYSLLLIGFLYINNISSKRKWNYAIASLYLFFLIFQSYYYIVWKIYGEIPVWSYDWSLMIRVLPLFLKTMGMDPILFASILIIILLILYYLIYKIHFFISRSCSTWSIRKLGWLSFIIFALPYGLKTFFPSTVDSNDSKSGILWIIYNINVAITKSRVDHLPDLSLTNSYDLYKDLPLKSKPNIYLIFLEAYGSVLGCVPPYDRLYQDQLKQIESNLYSQGWHSASTLSNSTILGGRSWLGFTTVLSGLRINNHPVYEQLIHDHKGYPHLINTLNAQGYTTYRLNTMANIGKSFKALDSLNAAFFNVSSWTRFSDIPYQGYQYDYFGGIPDQYALSYWHENVLKNNDNPYFLFFITLSTHAPFYMPPPYVADWKSLDSIKTSSHVSIRTEATKPLDRYSQSVSYSLKVWENYILNQADTNALFILVGDHQPAGMEYLLHSKTDTYATPMHIISKDSTWTNLLQSRGFDSGMLPAFKPNSLLNHEGFYSLFMNLWAQKDALPNVPDYLPHGIK